MDAQALWTQLQQAAPEVARLACLGALAVRLDPALLRRLRRQLLGAHDPGLEAELWFSPLVEARAADGIVLRADLLPQLHSALCELQLDGQRHALDEAWALTQAAHAGWPASLQLEERLAYLGLRGGPVDWDAAWSPVLLAIAESDQRAHDIARWALRALPRLPLAARDSEAGRAVLLASVARIGGHAALLPRTPPPERLRWLLPAGAGAAREDWWVEAGAQGLVLRRATVPSGGPPRLSLLATRPPLLQLQWQDGQGPQQRLQAVVDGAPLALPAEADDLVVRALDGQGWRLRPLAAAQPDAAQALRCVVHIRQGRAEPVMGVLVAPGRVLTVADIAPQTTSLDEVRRHGEAPQTAVQLVDNRRDPRSNLRLLTLLAWPDADTLRLADQTPPPGAWVTVMTGPPGLSASSGAATMPLAQALRGDDSSDDRLPPGSPIFVDGRLVALQGLNGPGRLEGPASDDPLAIVREFLRWALRPGEHEPDIWLHYAPDDPYGKGIELDEAALRRVSDAAEAMRLRLWRADDLRRSDAQKRVETIDGVQGALLVATPVTRRPAPAPELAPLALRAWADPLFPVLVLQYQGAQDSLPAPLAGRRSFDLREADEALQAAMHDTLDGVRLRHTRSPDPAQVERELARALRSPDAVGGPSWLAVERLALQNPGPQDSAHHVVELKTMLDLGTGAWLTSLQQAPAGSLMLLDLMPAELARLALAKAFFPLPPWRQLVLREQAWRDADSLVARVIDEVAQGIGFDIPSTATLLQQSRTPFVVTLMARPLPEPDLLQQLPRRLPGVIWLCLSDLSPPEARWLQASGAVSLTTGVQDHGLPLIQHYKQTMEMLAPRTGSGGTSSKLEPTASRRRTR